LADLFAGASQQRQTRLHAPAQDPNRLGG
jgi:hypothetical protein